MFRPADTSALAEAVAGATSRVGILAAWGSKWSRCPPEGEFTGLDLAAMGRLFDLSAGDLTCRVETGIDHGELTRLLAAAGLEWPLRPLPGQASLAHTYLSGAAYAASALFPNPRDWILGGTLVSGRGETVTTGGATIKNSAGYDLARSCFGSMGLAAAPAQLQLRLRPLPEKRTRMAAQLNRPQQYLAILEGIRRQLDVVEECQIGGTGGHRIQLSLGGPRDRVQEAAAALESTGLVTDGPALGVAAGFDWDGPRSRIGMSAHRMADLFDVDEKLGFWAFPLQRLAYLPPDAAERFQGRRVPQLLPLAKPRMLRDRIELLCRGLDPDRRFA